MELYEKKGLKENDSLSQGPQLPEWVKILDFYVMYFENKAKYEGGNSAK